MFVTGHLCDVYDELKKYRLPSRTPADERFFKREGSNNLFITAAALHQLYRKYSDLSHQPRKVLDGFCDTYCERFGEDDRIKLLRRLFFPKVVAGFQPQAQEKKRSPRAIAKLTLSDYWDIWANALLLNDHATATQVIKDMTEYCLSKKAPIEELKTAPKKSTMFLKIAHERLLYWYTHTIFCATAYGTRPLSKELKEHQPFQALCGLIREALAALKAGGWTSYNREVCMELTICAAILGDKTEFVRDFPEARVRTHRGGYLVRDHKGVDVRDYHLHSMTVYLLGIAVCY